MLEHRCRLYPFAHDEMPWVQGVEAALSALDNGTVNLAYRLRGDLAGLSIPGPARPRRADGLWRHTCFELFVATAGASAYQEFNFAPSRQWAAYTFRTYRERSAEPWQPAVPRIQITRQSERIELAVTLAPASLPPAHGRIGLAAVVEARDGQLGYWALNHPLARPDFHHPQSFVLEWPPPPACPR
jgi:hypothetical protein